MNGKIFFRILFLFLAVIPLAPRSAHAIDLTISQRLLTPLELFNRCYVQFTQLRLSPTNPLRLAVVAGTIKPIDACMQLLGEADLNSSGTLATTTTTPAGVNESLAVLKTFRDAHHMFTQNPEFDGSLQETAAYRLTRFFYDEGEFGLHFTHALFAPGAKASDIVTLSTGMEAIRDGATQNTLTSVVGPISITLPEGSIPAGSLVQIGNFIGVRPISANSAKTSANATISGYKVILNQSDGGGVLGTQAYLLSNFGRENFQTMDGGVLMPRRWAKAVFKDLLCRDVPVVRQTDVAAMVETTAAAPPFRKAVSCMACHGAMDPVAATARNNMLDHDFGNPTITNAIHLAKFPYANGSSYLTAESGVVDADPQFYLRPPNGTLYFRSYDGTLIDQPLTSIADLGTHLAATNDYYACTAAKYFKLLTGIMVNLQDAGDTTLPALSTADLYYRNLVIQMGQDLKTSENLQSLIREILSSDPYQHASNRSSQ